MKSVLVLALATVATVAVAPSLHAGEVTSGDFSKSLPVPMPPPASGWTFGFGFAPLVNVDASFSGLGSWNSPNPLPAAGPGVNRTYDDGFNNLDSSGNNNNRTWNWGYDNAAQYDPSGAGSIDLSVYNSSASASVDADDEFHPGLEFFALRPMGSVPNLVLGGHPVQWGWKAGFNYVHLDVEDSGTLSSGVLRVTDRFSLGGVIPPQAPYAGSFAGPGPLLSDLATRSTTALPGFATVAGSRDLDADLFAFSAGPYLEISPVDRLTVLAEAGLTLALATGDYRFTSTTTVPGLAPQTTTGRADETTILPGFYLGTSVLYDIDDRWGVYGSIRYQFLDDFDLGAAGSRAGFSFDESFFLSIGATRKF